MDIGHRTRRLLLIAALALYLCGCTKKETPTDTRAAQTEENTPTAAYDPLALAVPHDTVIYDKAPLPTEIRLTPCGSFTDTSHAVGFFGDGTVKEAVMIDGTRHYYLLGTDGQRVYETPFLMVSALTDGVFAVTEDKNSVDRVGLAMPNGTLAVPCDAAFALPLTGKAVLTGGTRYIELFYATLRADNAEKAFFTIDGAAYDGYALLFDTEKKRIVPGICLSGNVERTPDTAAGYFAVRDAISGDAAVYNADGRAVLTFAGTDEILCGRDVLLVRIGGETRLYEYNGTADYVTNEELSVIAGEGRYFSEKRGDGYAVLDRYGNRVLSESFEEVLDEYAGVLTVIDRDGAKKLVGIEGNVILQAQNGEDFPALPHGFRVCGENKYLSPEGTVFTADGDADKLVFRRETENETALYVLNDRDFTLVFPKTDVLALSEALAAVREDGEYVVYELFGGREILRGGYGGVVCVGQLLYARRGDTVDLFLTQTVTDAGNE